jgi:O-antigen/teichoic acid export membrane protein
MTKTLVGAACLSIQPLALNVLSVPVMAFIIRRLGPEGYGRWMVATAIIAVAATLTSLGLRGSFVRGVAADPGSARTALAEQLGLRLLLVTLVAALVVVACLLLGYPSDVLWCALVGLTGLALATCATTLADLLQAFHRVKTIAAVNAAAGVALTATSAVVAWLHPSPVAIATAYLTGPLFATALLWRAVSNHICAVSVRWDLLRFGRLLAESRFFAAQQLLSAGSAQAEGLILPRVIGINDFGFFTAGTLLASRLTALPDGLCTAAYPALVKASADRAADGARLVLAYLLIAGLGGIMVAAAGMLAAEPIGQILFPGHPALFAAITRVTIWSLPLMAVESVIGNALNACKRDGAQARVSVPAAAISLLISVTLVSTLGLTGACWSMLLRPAVRVAFLAPLAIRTFCPSTDVRAESVPFAPTLPPPLLRKAG